MPSRRPRVRALALVAGIAILVIPGAIAPAPPAHIEGRSQLTDAHLESDSGNITVAWMLNQTVANKLWLGNATNTYIERGVSGLTTNASWNSTRASATDLILQGYIPNDAAPRVTIEASGKFCVGVGANSPDTCWYRSGADAWRTDDAVTITGPSGLQVADGAIQVGGIGGGTANPQVQKDGPNLLTITQTTKLTIQEAVSDAGTVAVGEVGPAGAPGILLGATGDTNLYRAAADTLKTDDTFAVGSGIITFSNGGTKPACDSTTRGQLRATFGGAGVADVIETCVKSATDTYSWKAVATG